VRRVGQVLLSTAAWLILAVLTLWAVGALYFNFPVAVLRRPSAIIYMLAVLAIVAIVKGRWRKAGLVAGAFVLVLVCWLTLQPSNNRDWQADVAQTAWAEVEGDRVTLHNVRNNDYRTELDYTPHWETRTVYLSKLRDLDLAMAYWGPKWMAHPLVSFEFDDALPVCFSIEVRLEKGEEYSSLGGIYRYAELIYVCADERDVIRLRSNFRKDQDVYLYRTKATPQDARERFLEYLNTLNRMHVHPRWYNALTTNCTTAIRAQHAAEKQTPWDWRIIVNGYLDQMLYEHGTLSGDLPFAQLKEAAHINPAARAATDVPDFSAVIRAGRAGFLK
jgi:hypothetical protein